MKKVLFLFAALAVMSCSKQELPKDTTTIGNMSEFRNIDIHATITSVYDVTLQVEYLPWGNGEPIQETIKLEALEGCKFKIHEFDLSYATYNHAGIKILAAVSKDSLNIKSMFRYVASDENGQIDKYYISDVMQSEYLLETSMK